MFRIGDSSVYIFDIFFVMLLALFILKLRFYVEHLFYLVFVVAGFLGFFFGAIFGSVGLDVGKFIVVVSRFVQLSLFFAVLIHFSNVSGCIARGGGVWLAIMFLISFPLLYAVVFLFVDPSEVFVFDRLAGFFGNPSYLALYVVISLPLAIKVLFLPVAAGYVRFFIGFCFFSSAFVCLIYSGSVSGWLLAIASFLVTLLLSSPVRFLVCMITVLMFLFFISGSEALIVGLAELLGATESSGVVRTIKFVNVLMSFGDVGSLGSGDLRRQIQEVALNVFSEDWYSILFGVGFGQSPLYIAAEIGDELAAHNGYVVLLVETGIVGFLSISIFWCVLLMRLSGSVKDSSVFSGYFLAMLATPYLYLPVFWGPVLVVAIYIKFLCPLVKRD